jgi:hypothetical protein
MDRFGDSIKNLELPSVSIPDGGKATWIYGAGACACLVVYGYRYGVRALREYWINKTNHPNRVDAGTSLDAVLYGSLKGVGKGIIPSLAWPALLASYGIIKVNEDRIKKEVQEELRVSQEQKNIKEYYDSQASNPQ